MKAAAGGRAILTIAQACCRADVSRRTIYNWLAAGKVEYVRTAGGAVRIFEDTLFRCVDATDVCRRSRG